MSHDVDILTINGTATRKRKFATFLVAATENANDTGGGTVKHLMFAWDLF